MKRSKQSSLEGVEIQDEATKSEAVADVSYEIASFGWDPDVDGLCEKT